MTIQVIVITLKGISSPVNVAFHTMYREIRNLPERQVFKSNPKQLLFNSL